MLEAHCHHSDVFDLPAGGTIAFYSAMAASIRDAEKAIYRSGRGFRTDSAFIGDLLAAERSALKRGVNILRIQTSPRSGEAWADGYADLVDSFPEQLRVMADFVEPALGDLGLVDPLGSRPVVQLLFE